jgi:hypothetical protein
VGSESRTLLFLLLTAHCPLPTAFSKFSDYSKNLDFARLKIGVSALIGNMFGIGKQFNLKAMLREC